MNSLDRLLPLLEQGATIVTPNNRLAQDITNYYYQQQNKAVLAKPHCLPYEAFLIYLFNTYCNSEACKNPPILLNPQQLEFLWNEIVGDSISPGVIAEISEAWRRCLRWQIDYSTDAFNLTPQATQFQNWVKLMDEHIASVNAITVDHIVSFIQQQDSIGVAEQIIWYCFDDFTPQQLILQQQLTQQGSVNQVVDLAQISSEPQLCYARDEHDEIAQLIDWLVIQQAEHARKIGIIMPNIADAGEQLLRELQREFPSTRFNISLGLPLQTFPLVAHALEWLYLDTDYLHNNQARLLLYSPFLLHAQTEFSGRCQALETCRSLQEIEINFGLFVMDISAKAPTLAGALKSIPPYPHKATIGQWADFFINRLNHLGFPGDNPLDSVSYQCYQRFLTLFDSFQSIHFISSQLTKSQALATFSSLANATFQPQTVQADIEILGWLEGSGRTFDSLWIMGSTNDNLPAKIQPSAFIPLEIQRDFNMPRATNERELNLASQQISRFSNCSPVCVFSFPRQSSDKPNLPSSLITHLPKYSNTAKKVAIHKTNELVKLEDSYYLPTQPEDNYTGGTSLLANQAKCPFRAFAAHRLHAKTSQPYSDGISHLERGQIFHKVMEHLWLHFKDQRTLMGLTSSELEQIVTETIQETLKPLLQWRSYSFAGCIAQVETNSIAKRVHALLDWDKQRPEFCVEHIEQEFFVSLSSLTIKMRVDRLDRLTDHSKWIIDYKNSIPAQLPWNEQRPQEPQMLLYALIDDKIEGLLFLSTYKGNSKVRGVARDANSVSGIADCVTWSSKQTEWRQQLEALAVEFEAGHCEPKPLSATTCSQCDFQRICRFRA